MIRKFKKKKYKNETLEEDAFDGLYDSYVSANGQENKNT